MSIHFESIQFGGKEYSLETGRFAKFANGSVMVRCGDTLVLVTAVADSKEKIDIDYLPLQVEYREKTASAGKIPGGFLKREGRPSDHEVLTARLIDRPIRPLIPESWRFETQVIATVFSAEPDTDPDTIAAVGASAALMISDIPFHGPIAEVKVGRINGELVINPSNNQLLESDIDITVAGTDTSIVMVEGESKEISEEDFLKALEFAHENIKVLNQLQHRFAEGIKNEKRAYTENVPDEEISIFIKDFISEELRLKVNTISSKAERSIWRQEIFDKVLTEVQEKFSENERFVDVDLSKMVEEILHDLEKYEMRRMILEDHKRLDGRGLTDIRPITCEIGLLPRTHGSALFTRGETQSLTTVTLGTKSDEQMIDGLQPVYTNRFILHYNFPPFCTGEVGRLGTGRREIGHGNLAERALKNLIPEQSVFPYTIRVVSDILESNGSSSMATVCAGSLALFDAGVPLKKAVAGIAMGLIKEDDKIAILSDILGDEDHLGDMDFKVAGTVDGITAFQMDIKIEGLSIEIMTTALEQARAGRMHKLLKMNETISEPKEALSQYAPRFTTMRVPLDMIGAIIGPGGENIRSIVKNTGTDINIDDDGTVLIAATSESASNEAMSLIEASIRKPEEGEVYLATVKEIREGLGAIMEFLPKKQGLLHISQIAYEHTTNVADLLKVGDKIEVKLLEITRDGKFRLSRKALLPKPVEEKREDRSYPREQREPREHREHREIDSRRDSSRHRR